MADSRRGSGLRVTQPHILQLITIAAARKALQLTSTIFACCRPAALDLRHVEDESIFRFRPCAHAKYHESLRLLIRQLLHPPPRFP